MTKFEPIGKLTAAVTLALGLSAANAGNHEQLPATQHQSDVVPGVATQQAQPQIPPGADVETAHQEQVLRDFAAADANKDGTLSVEEYRNDARTRSAHAYYKSLHDKEKHGSDAIGPRDNQAAQ